MKVGISAKLDVTKIDKARLFKGQKGTYLDFTMFVDIDNQGQYGDNGMITQDVSKEEKEAGQQGAILGNVKVFWKDGGQQAPQQQPRQQQSQQAPQQYQSQPNPQQAQDNQGDFNNSFDDDLPF